MREWEGRKKGKSPEIERGEVPLGRSVTVVMGLNGEKCLIYKEIFKK